MPYLASSRALTGRGARHGKRRRYRDRQQRHASFRRSGTAAGAGENACPSAAAYSFWTIRSPRLTARRRTRCLPICRNMPRIRLCSSFPTGSTTSRKCRQVIFMEDGKTADRHPYGADGVRSGVPHSFTKARQEGTDMKTKQNETACSPRICIHAARGTDLLLTVGYASLRGGVCCGVAFPAAAACAHH